MPTLELLDPAGVIQATLQRALDLVSYGLQAASTASVESLEIPGLAFQMTPAGNLAMSVDTARAEFPTWILAHGLRDCVEAIGPSLEWARKTCFLWSTQGEVVQLEDGKLRLSAQISGQDWNANIVEEASRFNWLPLPHKLDHLQQRYGFRPTLSDHILSINAARNCLSHRRGIVGPEDSRPTEQRGLLVKWRKPQLVVVGLGAERVLQIPARVEAGESVGFRHVDNEKLFGLGTRIAFSPEEFVEIVFTFFLFASEIQTSIRSLQQRRAPGPE